MVRAVRRKANLFRKSHGGWSWTDRGRTADVCTLRWMMAGHETAQAVSCPRYSGRIRVRYADTQTRWRESSASDEYTRIGGFAGEPKTCMWAVYVQDSDDEADVAVVCAERGGGDQVAECSASADSEANGGWGRSWRSERKSGVEARGWRWRGGAGGRDVEQRTEAKGQEPEHQRWSHVGLIVTASSTVGCACPGHSHVKNMGHVTGTLVGCSVVRIYVLLYW